MNALWHYWHPVLWSREVTDKPVPVKLLDQPLVIWRADGEVSAFYDLCLHRGAALSLGWMNGDRLVCGYHGWNYAPGGRCTLIPSLPRDHEIPAKARAKAYNVQERYGLVWVCLDEPRQDIPEFPPEFEDPSFNWEPYTYLSMPCSLRRHAARNVATVDLITGFRVSVFSISSSRRRNSTGSIRRSSPSTDARMFRRATRSPSPNIPIP